MRCGLCAIDLIKHDKTPRCKTSKGCPIESLAKDKELQGKVDAFWRLRSLIRYGHYNDLVTEQLKAHGLDDPRLLLKLEEKIEQYRKSKEEQQPKAEGKGNKKWESSAAITMTSK